MWQIPCHWSSTDPGKCPSPVTFTTMSYTTPVLLKSVEDRDTESAIFTEHPSLMHVIWCKRYCCEKNWNPVNFSKQFENGWDDGIRGLEVRIVEKIEANTVWPFLHLLEVSCDWWFQCCGQDFSMEQGIRTGSVFLDTEPLTSSVVGLSLRPVRKERADQPNCRSCH